jgi:hypothetical protein
MAKNKMTADVRKEVAIKKKARSEATRAYEAVGDQARAKARAISSRGTGKVRKTAVKSNVKQIGKKRLD